ncbi:MAG: response regulator [Methylophilaceae bacterium]
MNTQSMKALLVEDSFLLREAIMETLSSCNGLAFEAVAATQNEAVALLNERAFDILIVDIELAQGNGFEVIRETLKDDFPFAKPLSIIFTNHAHTQYRQLAKALGVQHFFDKSMDFDLAIDTIEAETQKFMASK